MKKPNSSSQTSCLKRSWQRGVSLVEVVLIMTLMAATVLPLTLITNQMAQNAKGVYVQSSRSILLNSLMDEATADRNYYAQSYTAGNATTMKTNVSDAGQVLPWRSVVDTTNAGATDSFVKTIYFYLYTNTTDAMNSPRFQSKMVNYKRHMRVRFDSSQQGFMDASGQWWNAYDTYDATNKVPGISSASSLYANDASSILNLPSHRDAELYQNGWWRSGAAINYDLPVPSGMYTVKLYFSELVQANRYMDIYLEGNLMNPNTPYNATLYTGNQLHGANVQMFDITVTDGTLNIQISPNGSTNPYIQAIMVKRRTE